MYIWYEETKTIHTIYVKRNCCSEMITLNFKRNYQTMYTVALDEIH